MIRRNAPILEKTLKIIFLSLSLIQFFLIYMCEMNKELTYNNATDGVYYYHLIL